MIRLLSTVSVQILQHITYSIIKSAVGVTTALGISEWKRQIHFHLVVCAFASDDL